MTKKKEDRHAKAANRWVVKKTVEPKTDVQKTWWLRGAGDVIKALEEWAIFEDDKARKAVKKRGSVLRDSKKKA